MACQDFFFGPLLKKFAHHWSILWCTVRETSKHQNISFKFIHQNIISISLLLHACHMTRESLPPSYDHPNKMRWWLTITEFRIVQFHQSFSYFSLLRPKYLSQLPAVEQRRHKFLPWCDKSSFTSLSGKKKCISVNSNCTCWHFVIFTIHSHLSTLFEAL